MFIKIRKRGILCLALVPLIAINCYVGGRIAKKNVSTLPKLGNVENVIEMPDRDSYMEVTDEGNTLAMDTEEERVEEVSQGNVFENLSLEYRNSGKDVSEILNTVNNRNDKLYISALYEKLKQEGLSDLDVREQTDNIMSLSLFPTDFSEEEWENLFGKMNRTLGEYENPTEFYYPLARYIHESECNLEHHQWEYDENRITCDNLVQLNNNTIKKISMVDYVFKMVFESEDAELINSLNRILYSEVEYEEVLKEFETMYEMMQVPCCVPLDVWNSSFKCLLTTVSEYENIFDVYGRLATYVHILNCDLEHSLNEFDVMSCDNVKRLRK